jgi:hypothetical protein
MIKLLTCIFVFYMKSRFPLHLRIKRVLYYGDKQIYLSRFIFKILTLFSFLTSSAQDSSLSGVIKKEIYNKHDFTHVYPYNSKRIKLIAATNIAGYSAAMVGLYAAWYKDYPQSSFHTFDDLAEWKQMDKIGHLYSAYAESKASMELWRWTGINRKKKNLARRYERGNVPICNRNPGWIQH